MIGNDSTNSRHQPFERTIGPANASRLALKWTATTAGDISATPAVVNGAVYCGDFGGMLWKLDAATGAILWQFGAGSSVNSGPAVVDGTVYWGSGYSRSGVEGSGNNRLYAFSVDGL
jgi:polyvinyl alcohol dehydrogenase (cytochrome)